MAITTLSNTGGGSHVPALGKANTPWHGHTGNANEDEQTTNTHDHTITATANADRRPPTKVTKRTFHLHKANGPATLRGWKLGVVFRQGDNRLGRTRLPPGVPVTSVYALGAEHLGVFSLGKQIKLYT